jgi:hypothetical protein
MKCSLAAGTCFFRAAARSSAYATRYLRTRIRMRMTAIMMVSAINRMLFIVLPS